MNIRNLRQFFHFGEDNVQWLVDRFSGVNEETRGRALSSVHEMEICLAYLAGPVTKKG